MTKMKFDPIRITNLIDMVNPSSVQCQA